MAAKKKKILRYKKSMSSPLKKALVEFSELTDSYVLEVQKRNEKAEKWWTSLTQKEQMQAFYSVVKRIHQGELEEDSSYRTILYQVFGFPAESYSLGMECGFFNLHQCIEKNSRENLKRKIKLAFISNNIDEDKIDWKKIGEILHWEERGGV